MLPWQRRELYAGNSLEEFSRIRNLLDANRVPYDDRAGGQAVSARNMPPRTEVMGRWGTAPESDAVYYIFVKKDDFENARNLISQK